MLHIPLSIHNIMSVKAGEESAGNVNLCKEREETGWKGKFKRILYGGDYNPKPVAQEIWDEDMRIFRDARINSATVNVFSWARLQPSEETTMIFEQLDDIVDMLSRENYDMRSTSTASLRHGW